MYFPDLPLARRLELHEAWSSSAHARTQARLYPQTGAAVEAVDAGCMVYCGRKSPLSLVYGWGVTGPVSASDLVRIEAFYRERGLPPRIRVCTLADPSLLELLGQRRYIVLDHMNVYARHVTVEDEEALAPPDVSIRPATLEEAKQWFEQSDAGGDWAEPDGLAFMLVRCIQKPDTRLFIAWRNGQPIGAGALETHDGVAALMAAGTQPASRNQGVHTALLHARLAAAASSGCELALVHTRPGAVSQRNVLRAGFQLVYTVDTMASSS